MELEFILSFLGEYESTEREDTYEMVLEPTRMIRKLGGTGAYHK